MACVMAIVVKIRWIWLTFTPALVAKALAKKLSALSTGYYDAYYLKAQKIRRLISEDFKQALTEVDVIMGPVTPTTAFGIGEKMDDPIEMYLSDIYTIAINLAGVPALSIPAGFVAGMPVGLQIIGNYFAEDKLLNIAHQYQQVTDWHLHTPNGFE